ncbi:hypothetical protein ACHAWF_001168, partial [Thalassiosira exigua]
MFIANNKSGRLVTINVLEFISIIINYAAALVALTLDDDTDDPYPVLLNESDSAVAIKWTNHHCKESLAGRALGRLFCALLIGSRLGINAKHIRGEENDVADAISRLRRNRDSDLFDYSLLKQQFPQLQACRVFQPSQELLSLVWQCHGIEPRQWLGNGDDWRDLVSLFAHDIIAGNGIKSSDLRAQTVRGYLESINTMFEERGYDPPTDFSLKQAPPALFYENCKTWEEEPNRRTHMQPPFLSELLSRAKLDSSGTGLISLVADLVVLGRYTGHRLAEYGQSTQTKIDYHMLPNGRGKIMKAFMRGDFKFFDASGHEIIDPVNDLKRIHSITIRWRVQKNRRNGQKISWVRDFARPDLCPVMAALRIFDRSIRLGRADDQPMCCYLEHFKTKSSVKYITGAKIRDVFRDVAKAAFPDISKQELSQYSAHMIRVSAC